MIDMDQSSMPVFVECGGHIFQQIVDISIGTNCAPLFEDLFVYFFQAEFIESILKNDNKKLAKWFNLTFRCTSYLELQLEYNNQVTINYTHCYMTNVILILVTFPHLGSNIPSLSACVLYISQLSHFSQAYSHYGDILFWAKVL